MKISTKLLTAFLIMIPAMILGGCTPMPPGEYYDYPPEIVLIPVPVPYPHPGPDYPAPQPTPPRYKPLTKPDVAQEPAPRTKTREFHFESGRTQVAERQEETPRKSPRFVSGSGRSKSGNR